MVIHIQEITLLWQTQRHVGSNLMAGKVHDHMFKPCMQERTNLYVTKWHFNILQKCTSETIIH